MVTSIIYVSDWFAAHGKRLDRISPNNSTPWEMLGKMMASGNHDQDTEFWFCDKTKKNAIRVVDPFNNLEFKRFVSNPHVYLCFVNQPNLVGQVEIVLRSMPNTVYNNRIRNVDVYDERSSIPSEELERIRTAESLQKYFEFNESNGESVFHLPWDQLQSDSGIVKIRNAVEMMYDRDRANGEGKVKLAVVQLDNKYVSKNNRAYLGQMIVSMENSGYPVTVESDNSEVINDISVSISQSRNGKMSISQRYNTMKNKLKPGYAGILHTYYTNTVKKDEYGRNGEGKILRSIPAIFRKFVKFKDTSGNMRVGAIFDTFPLYKLVNYSFGKQNCECFVTQVHWAGEHDGDLTDFESLPMKTVRIDLGLLGFWSEFIGSTYHFGEPVQEDVGAEGGDKWMAMVTEGGKVKSNLLSIPERMKVVFDDFGIDYDKEYMESCINRTMENLHRERQA